MLQKIQFSPEKYRYLEWTEERSDKGKNVHQLQEKLDKHRYREKTTHEKSEWREVISGVSQGFVLAPIIFLVYVNDMIRSKQLHKPVCR